jgi:hypothetical protein
MVLRRTFGRLSMASVACSAVLAASCGSSTTTTAAAPTKAEYIAKADAICRVELSRKTQASAGEGTAGKSSITNRNRDLDAAEEANARLRALPQPSGSASVLDEWLKLRERVTAIDRGRSASVRERLEDAKTYRIAKGYGLQSCAEQPGIFLFHRLYERQPSG